MTYSHNSNGFDDSLANESSIFIDGDVNSHSNGFNPDDFLNMEMFKNEMKNESPSPSSSYQHSPQQLTPPISPHPASPIVVDSSIFQKIRIIPLAALVNRQQVPEKKIKLIVPKPSSSSDSDNANTTKTVANLSTLHSPVDKAHIKQQRLIRNREAANLSRRKQKEYVQSLEAQNAELRKENIFLRTENSQLKEQLKSFCVSTKLPSKNATFLLAVLFMVGFNVVPFRSIISNSNVDKPVATKPFSSRHLLFLENSTSVVNETMSQSAEPDVPIYSNQTDHIRKANIENIRRWIPAPDLFNVTYLEKQFDFNPDPLQEKLAKMYEKSREQAQKKNVKPSKKRSPKNKPMIGPVQLYNANMNIIKLNEFFDEINRQDDTFYVFSFRADHLLLPAIDNSYNFSQIKMNLIMPRNNGELRLLGKF